MKTVMGNNNLLQVRLTMEQMEERDALKMTDIEYFKYLTAKEKTKNPTQSSMTFVNQNLPKENENQNHNNHNHYNDREKKQPEKDNQLFDEMKIRHEAEKKSLKLESQNEYLLKEIEELKKKNNSGLNGIDAIVDEKMRVAKEKEEHERLVKSESELLKKVDLLTEKNKELERDSEELMNKLKMKELVKEFGPSIGRLVMGFRSGGVDGLLHGLSTLGQESEEQQVIQIPQTTDPVIQDKIKFAESFAAGFPDKEIREKVLRLCGILASHNEYIDSQIDFLIKDINKKHETPDLNGSEENLKNTDTENQNPNNNDNEY